MYPTALQQMNEHAGTEAPPRLTPSLERLLAAQPLTMRHIPGLARPATHLTGSAAAARDVADTSTRARALAPAASPFSALLPAPPSFRCAAAGCGKSFKERKVLRKHMLTHQPRRFKCAHPGCGKSFYERAKLKRHDLVHSGEKRFACEEPGCSKRFALKANLQTHARVHTGVRPFACPFAGCHKRFSQTSGRNSHMRTHANERRRCSVSEAPPITPGCSGADSAPRQRLSPSAAPLPALDRATVARVLGAQQQLHLQQQQPGFEAPRMCAQQEAPRMSVPEARLLAMLHAQQQEQLRLAQEQQRDQLLFALSARGQFF